MLIKKISLCGTCLLYCTSWHTLSSMNHWVWNWPFHYIYEMLLRSPTTASLGLSVSPFHRDECQEGNARRRSPVRFFNAQSAASMRKCIASLARPLARRPVGSLSLVLVTVSRFSEDKLTGPHLSRRHNHCTKTILILCVENVCNGMDYIQGLCMLFKNFVIGIR